jgi:hypothetical protein
MISRTAKIRTIGQLTTAILPLFSAPALASGTDASSVVAMLGLSGHQIAPSELGTIRGGFETPSLSINFAFKQIEAVDGKIVQTIIVPQTTVTELNAETRTISSSIPLSVTSTTNSVTDKTNTVPTSTVAVTDASGSTQTITPSAGSSINVTTVANNGLTTINTQLGNNGYSNVTTNLANNTAISVAATMNIAVSGLTQFLAQQQSFANPQSGLYYGGAFK